jgi:PhoPQ-activated pathogenicity-related protein
VHRCVAFSLRRLWLACRLAFAARVEIWQRAVVVMVVVVVVVVAAAVLLLLLLLLDCGVLANGENCSHSYVTHS